MFFDPLYLLIAGPGLLLSAWASWRVHATFKRYREVATGAGMSGADVAREILRRAGLGHVEVTRHEGFLSDHYDPRTRVVRLSPDVYDGRSIASVGVAAHETGHALQHAKNYAPLAFRSLVVPVAGIGSQAGPLIFIGGMIFQSIAMAYVGVILFAVVVAFQLVTLPVEFDASSRAKRVLQEYALVAPGEREGVAKMLSAAAMTYVAAALTSILTLAYYVIQLTGMRHRED